MLDVIIYYVLSLSTNVSKSGLMEEETLQERQSNELEALKVSQEITEMIRKLLLIYVV